MNIHARYYPKFVFMLLTLGFLGAQNTEQVLLSSRAELIELEQLISNQGTAIKTAEKIISIEDFAKTLEDQGRYNTLLARSVSLLALQQNYELAYEGLNRLYNIYLSSSEDFPRDTHANVIKYFGLGSLGEVFLQIPQYLIQLGRYEDAKSWLSNYLSRPQESTNIFLAAIHLARILYIEGNSSRARQLLIQRFYPGLQSGNPSVHSEKALFLLAQIAKLIEDKNLKDEVIGFFEDYFSETMEYQIVFNQKDVFFELPNPGSLIPSLNPTLLVLDNPQVYEYSGTTANIDTDEHDQSAETSSLKDFDVKIIQVGFFRNTENADRLLNRLVTSGFQALLKPLDDGVIVYIPVEDENSKNTTLLSLKDAGFEGFLANLPSE